MREAIIVLAVALVLAGCIGKDAPEDATIEAAATEAEPSAAAPATAASTGAKPSVAATPPAANASAALPPAPVVVPFDAAGNTGENVWICPPALGCAGFQGLVAPMTRVFEPELPGVPVAWDLTLTWTANDPTNGALRLGVERCLEGEPCELSFVDGGSPLQLVGTSADLAFAPGEQLRIFVWRPPVADAEAKAYAGSDQGFTITGTLTVQPPA